MLLMAAAFGRLCVETGFATQQSVDEVAAAFGRLCVETNILGVALRPVIRQPPSGGCVLKQCEGG